MGDAVGGMSDMLNALLDINQIEAGGIQVEAVDHQIGGLLDRLKNEFGYHAESRGLALHVVPCSLSIRSDPRLLEQMLRNLLLNAMKYTLRGKVLFGCRRRAGVLSIEIWDTGVGIPDEALPLIFEEYYQLESSTGGTGRGLGLGLSIVKRIADMLGHRIRVRSWPGRGSSFAIEVMLAPGAGGLWRKSRRPSPSRGAAESEWRTGTILVVEDDPQVREQLTLHLESEGHHAVTASDGTGAMESVEGGTVQPDVILADHKLPTGVSGLQLVTDLRSRLHRNVPAAILTGDISTNTVRKIERHGLVHVGKSVKSKELTRIIQRLLGKSHRATVQALADSGDAAVLPSPAAVFVVDDDLHVREQFRRVLEKSGHRVETYASSEAFLKAYRPANVACLLIDASLPGMSGIELLERMNDSDEDNRLTSIMITGHGDTTTAVRAMKAGASDFIEKPIGHRDLCARVAHALERSRDSGKLHSWQEDAKERLASLTPRQRQILDLVLAGHPNKIIAADLGISRRTVENHRAAIMRKTGSKSLPALARLAVASRFKDTAGRDQPGRRTPFPGAPPFM